MVSQTNTFQCLIQPIITNDMANNTDSVGCTHLSIYLHNNDWVLFFVLFIALHAVQTEYISEELETMN